VIGHHSLRRVAAFRCKLEGPIAFTERLRSGYSVLHYDTLPDFFTQGLQRPYGLVLPYAALWYKFMETSSYSLTCYIAVTVSCRGRVCRVSLNIITCGRPLTAMSNRYSAVFVLLAVPL